MTKNMENAEKIFTSVVKGTNFMTPKLVGYYAINNGAAELTKGRFMGKTIYGVTVVKDGKKSDDLNQCLHSYEDAINYIKTL